MTVPPLSGWEGILALVVVLLAVGVAFLVIWAFASSGSERAEWQAWLDGRSGAGHDAPGRPESGPAGGSPSDREHATG